MRSFIRVERYQRNTKRSFFAPKNNWRFSAMKKALSLILALTLILAFAVPAIAANDKNVINVYLEGDEIHQDFNNAQFHCNCISGNTRVWPVIPADMKKFDGSLTFTKGQGTEWYLTGIQNKAGEYLDMVECPVCQSKEWVTFSNNSGAPDGKNVQMQHPGENATIVKDWIKMNPTEHYGDTVLTAYFTVTVGSVKKNFSVANKASFFVPADLDVSVIETGCNFDGFTLISQSIVGHVYKFVNEDTKVITTDAIRYYAICQIWNDLVWGFDGYGLGYLAGFEGPYDYSLLPDWWVGDKTESNLTYGLFPVGVDHRTELMKWWNTDDKNVRYIPFGNNVNEEGYEFKWDEWADFILYSDVNKEGNELGISLQDVCELLGIDVDAFIEAYDTMGFLERNNLLE
jgi:hypothetical protein